MFARFASFFVWLLLAGCVSATVTTPVAQPMTWPSPRPYPSRTPPAAPTPPRAADSALLPTPTPRVYVVQPGDTMAGIAGRLGISLDALLQANPGVSPALLQPGDELIVPAADEPMALQPADGVRVLQVQCYPQTPSSSQCLFLVVNEGQQPVEDISVQLDLQTPAGEQVSVRGFLLLDALFPGQMAPGVVHLDGRWDDAAVQTHILTALPFDAAGGRYAPARIARLQWVGNDRLLTVSGQLQPAMADGQWRSAWVAVSLFDDAGRLVGARRLGIPAEEALNGVFSLVVSPLQGRGVWGQATALWANLPCEFCP